MGSRIFFIADLHLGHENIVKYNPTRIGSNSEEHDQWLINQWNSVVKAKDYVWILGDIAFKNCLYKLNLMNGKKNFILGNHDMMPISEYEKYGRVRSGIVKKYGFWLTHAPIHEGSLRGKKNVHGHTHSNKVDDYRYECVSVEQLNGIPISLEELRKRFNQRELREIEERNSIFDYLWK